MAIPPAPSLSSGRFGAGDGGGPGNRRADVNRLASYLSRPRFCSPSFLAGGARACRGVSILSGLLFLVASARRRRRRCRGISSSGLFLAPVTLCSGVNGEVAETCSGVFGQRRIVLRCVFWLLSPRIVRQLWVLRMVGEWIGLELSAAVSVVDGEFLSMVEEARGVSPADVISAFASSRSSMRVYTAATSKALRR